MEYDLDKVDDAILALLPTGDGLWSHRQ